MPIRTLLIVVLSAFSLYGCGGGAADGQAANLPVAAVYDRFKVLSYLSANQGHFSDIAARGTTAYVAAGWDGLEIVDVLDLKNPTIVGTISPYSITPNSADNIYAVAVNEKIAAVSVVLGCFGSCLLNADQGNEVLRLYDVNTPTAPKLLSTLPAARRVALVGNLLYALRSVSSIVVSGGPSTFAKIDIIDVSVPATPVTLGSVAVGSNGRFIVQGNKIYITYSDRLQQNRGTQVIDVTNPSAPFVAASYGNPSTDGGSATPALFGSTLYAVDGSNNLQVFNLSADILAPTLVPIGATATGIAQQESILYITQAADGVAMYSLSTPAIPMLSQTITTDAPALSVNVFDQFGVIVTDEIRAYTAVGSDPHGIYTVTTKERLNFFRH